MFAILAIFVHAFIGSTAALAIAPYSIDPAGNSETLWVLALASAVISCMGLLATTSYLSKRIRAYTGALIGLLCGLLCSALLGTVITMGDFSLTLYLCLLFPTLLAVLLATLMDRPKSGWQT